MQPTTNHTVPATSSAQNQVVDRQPKAAGQAPIPLSAELLRQIGGGLTTQTPSNGW